MSGIKPLWDALALAYYRWALSEIRPLHPDVPRIVLRVNQLSRGK